VGEASLGYIETTPRIHSPSLTCILGLAFKLSAEKGNHATKRK